MHPISGIILAGGKGERMGGRDKGLQLYRDKRLIEHVIARVAPQVDELIISANRNLTEYRSLGFTVVSDDQRRFDGPLAGIASAIPHCRHQWVLVVPCDMPALPDDLVATMSKHTDRASLITIRSNGRLQLVFLMHCNLLATIREQLADGQRTVMRWLDASDPFVLTIDNENRFYNINATKQLEYRT